VGGANTTSILAAYFAKRNTKFGGGESEGGAGIPFPPNPLSFPPRPSVQFGAPQLRGHQFRSKKVRISSNKRTGFF